MKALRRFFKFCRSKLVFKFCFFSLVLITALSSFIYLAINSIVTGTLYEQHKLRGVSIAANLAANAADFLLVKNFSQLQLLLKNTQQSEQETVYIFILDAKGQVQAHTFPGGFPADLRKLHQRLDNQSDSTQLIATEQGVLLDIAVPILQGSLGYVHIGFSRQSIAQKISKIRQRILYLCIFACMVSIAIAVMYSKRITRPLTALAEGVANIEQGNFAYRVKSNKNDELGSVSRAFDQMAAALEREIIQQQKTQHDLATEKERLAVTLRSIGDGVITTVVSSTISPANFRIISQW